MDPRRRRPALAVLLAVGVPPAVVLAWQVTAWSLLAVPVLVVGAAAAWLGVGASEVLDLVDSEGDAGRGVPGLLP